MRTAGFIQVSAYADGWLHTGAQRNTLDSEIASAFHETYVVTLFVDVKVDYSY